MHRRIVVPAILVGVLFCPAFKSSNASGQNAMMEGSAGAQQNNSEVYWQGDSGGFHITWTAQELFVDSGTSRSKLFGAMAKNEFAKFAQDNRQADCSWGQDLVLLSVVGPIISFSKENYIDCGGAHPEISRRLTAVEVSKRDDAVSERTATLTDYFPEGDLLRAITADPVVKKALSKAPSRLSDLPSSISDELTIGPCPYELSSDYLSRFAFHHVEGDRVAVRLGLTSESGGGCQTKLPELGLLLNMPEGLKQSLELAESGKEGFLMRSIRRTGGQKTTFQFSTGKGSKFIK